MAKKRTMDRMSRLVPWAIAIAATGGMLAALADRRRRDVIPQGHTNAANACLPIGTIPQASGAV
jgi:hypothetical protein